MTNFTAVDGQLWVLLAYFPINLRMLDNSIIIVPRIEWLNKRKILWNAIILIRPTTNSRSVWYSRARNQHTYFVCAVDGIDTKQFINKPPLKIIIVYRVPHLGHHTIERIHLFILLRETKLNSFLIRLMFRSQEARSFKSGDVQQQESNNRAAASMKIQSDTFSAEKKAMKQAQQRQTVTSSGIFNQEKHVSSASQSNYMFSKQGMCSSGSSMITSSQSSKATNGHFQLDDEHKLDDLEKLSSSSNPKEVETAIVKYSQYLDSNVKSLQQADQGAKMPSLLNSMNEVVKKAWAVEKFGHELGFSLCEVGSYHSSTWTLEPLNKWPNLPIDAAE